MILTAQSNANFVTKLRMMKPSAATTASLLCAFFCTRSHALSLGAGASSSTTTAAKRENSENRSSSMLATSRCGLDPAMNRFHAPIVYHENYSFPNWPENHTFPMNKFSETAKALTTRRADSHLPRPLVRKEMDFFRPLDFVDVPKEWFSSVICADFLDRFLRGELTVEECRWIGFREQTSRPELIERTVLEVAGTILTCQLAHKWGIASNVAGGTHHASHDRGAGYTILNDLAIAANFITSPAINNGTANTTKTLVIDCDVHQGDGTAKFELEGLYTLSIHCEDNYPRPKATSTYDVGLPSGTSDEEYMAALEDAVERALSEIQPDFVLYDAGIDVYEKDVLGRLRVTEAGIRARDRYVLDKCVSSDIPVAAVVGGGYDKNIQALARRHAIVHEECSFIWRKYHMWQ